jgi:phosphonate transport system substrate-binding protein
VTHRLRLATFLAPNVLPVYQAVAGAIERELGIPTELAVGESFAQFAAGELDAGFICGLPYVELARQRPSPVEVLTAPVLAGDRYGSRPIYFSDVIVRRDSLFQSFADLRGRIWAYNDFDSHSGYKTSGFFGRVVAAGFHQRAMRMVAAGEVDGAAIDSQVLEIELRGHPALASELRVVEVLGPSTIQPLVVSAGLPPDLKAALREAVLRVHEDPAARRAFGRGLVERFVTVTDADYDDIREMLAVAEAAGFLTLA